MLRLLKNGDGTPTPDSYVKLRCRHGVPLSRRLSAASQRPRAAAPFRGHDCRAGDLRQLPPFRFGGAAGDSGVRWAGAVGVAITFVWLLAQRRG